MRNFVIAIFIFYLSSLNLTGQVDQEPENQAGELFLRIKNINFIKNNEYFNPITASGFVLISSLPGYVDKSEWIEGYTLPGFFFQPELVYSPSGKITYRAGIHLLQFYGSKKFSRIKPVISTTLNLSENTSLTVGSLRGSDTHMMFDPHFDSERLYSAYAEDGLQLTSSTDNLFTDTWLSWENFILKSDTTREVFTFGESFKYTSKPLADFFQIEIPLQIQFKHYGGQISNYNEHVETFFNLAAGIRLNFDLAHKKYGQAAIEYLAFINNVIPSRPSASINNGFASWFRIHYKYKVLYFGAAYWMAENFFSPNGNSIYASALDIHSDYIINERRVITNSLYINLFPESYLELFIGLDTYYNTCLKKMDYSTTLHLNLDKLIKIATLKQ